MCVWGVHIRGNFLDSHVVIWMLHFTDIVSSSDVATIVRVIEQSKSQKEKEAEQEKKVTQKQSS